MEECSKPLRSIVCTFSDPVRDASFAIDYSCQHGAMPTVRNMLEQFRAAKSAFAGEQELEIARYADSLFLLSDEGVLGDLIPNLRFRVRGRECKLDDSLPCKNLSNSIAIEIDRSETGYVRNWPAYLKRRWKLREGAYSQFVESIIDEAYGCNAVEVLARNSPSNALRFLSAVARRIFDAPYETYSRYLSPFAPFKSCDQTLDRIISGDGGNCAEKAMALYFVVHAYGFQSEIVLGGEDASGSFPYHALRSILNSHAFDFAGTRDVQRYWQHFSLLCTPSNIECGPIFCDVAGSNLPFFCTPADDVTHLLRSGDKEAIDVAITLEPLRVFYHALPHRQDLPLDLYYAMESLIDSIDVVQTFDNELGLLHTGDYWIGAFAYRSRRELAKIKAAYKQFVAGAGRNEDRDLCFVADLHDIKHTLHEEFVRNYPRGASQISAADKRIRARIRRIDRRNSVCYVILKLASSSSPIQPRICEPIHFSGSIAPASVPISNRPLSAVPR